MAEADFTIEPSPVAQEAVLVSNTPTFLFRRLREDPYVRYIASNYSDEDIVRWFAAHSDEPRDVHEVVLRYMYLAAIAFKESKEASDILPRISVRGLEWGEDIKRLVASEIPTGSQVISPRAARKSVTTNTTISGSGVVELSQPNTPRIWTP